jgi:hypothetical protein
MTLSQVLVVAAALLFLAACPNGALGQEILVWDMDGFDGGANGKTFQDPEGSGVVGCEYWIEQALAQNGYSCSTWAEMNLPPDISTYDVIFIVLGWC